MPFQIQHQADLPVNTLLRAKLTNMEVRVIPKKDGTTFERLYWTFEITQQGDFFGKTIRAEASNFWSDSEFNTNRSWAEALLNRPLAMGTSISESDLIGLPCDITVKYDEDRNDPKKKWARVEDIFAVSDGFGEPPF